MDWQKLDLAKASVLKREVDVALQRIYDNNPETNKSKLLSAIQYRIQELENFCAKNSDGMGYQHEPYLNLEGFLTNHLKFSFSRRAHHSVREGAIASQKGTSITSALQRRQVSRHRKPLPQPSWRRGVYHFRK